MNTLITNIKGLKEIGVAATAAKTQKNLVNTIALSVNAITVAVDKMTAANEKAHHAKSTSDASKAYCDKVKPYFDEIRKHTDLLETIVDDKVWPLPKYRERTALPSLRGLGVWVGSRSQLWERSEVNLCEKMACLNCCL